MKNIRLVHIIGLLHLFLSITQTFGQFGSKERNIIAANVTELRKTVGFEGAKCTLLGYYTKGDGGGQELYWDANSTEADNGGTIFQRTGTTKGRWKSVVTELIDAKQFGAKGDSLTDDTQNLKKALDFCIQNRKKCVIKTGIYKVSNSITSQVTYTGNEALLVEIVGKSKIYFASSASNITTPLIYFYHEKTSNVSIVGDDIELDLNNKCPIGITINCVGKVSATNYVLKGGFAEITAKIKIKNVFASSTTNGKAEALTIQGVFEKGDIRNITIQNVGRDASFTATGETKGLSVLNAKGIFSIENCDIKNIETYALDADGLSVFGVSKDANNSQSERLGVFYINNCVFTDCKGRSIKSQCSNTTVNNCSFFRKEIQSISEGSDIAFQYGNGTVNNCKFQYEKNDLGGSSLGSNFIPIVFHNILNEVKQSSIAQNLIFNTELSIRNLIYLISSSGALDFQVLIDNISVNSFKTHTGTQFTRGFVEFDAAGVYNSTGNSKIEIKNTVSNNTLYLLCYNSNPNAVWNNNKIIVNLENNVNRESSMPRIFETISGTRLLTIDKVRLKHNFGYSNFLNGAVQLNLAANNMINDTEIVVDLGQAVIQNGPANLPNSGYAQIISGSDYFVGFQHKKIITQEKSYQNSGTAWRMFTHNTADANLKVEGSTNGLMLQSPNGLYWKVQVNNSGTLTITQQ